MRPVRPLLLVIPLAAVLYGAAAMAADGVPPEPPPPSDPPEQSREVVQPKVPTAEAAAAKVARAREQALGALDRSTPDKVVADAPSPEEVAGAAERRERMWRAARRLNPPPAQEELAERIREAPEIIREKARLYAEQRPTLREELERLLAEGPPDDPEGAEIWADTVRSVADGIDRNLNIHRSQRLEVPAAEIHAADAEAVARRVLATDEPAVIPEGAPGGGEGEPAPTAGETVPEAGAPEAETPAETGTSAEAGTTVDRGTVVPQARTATAVVDGVASGSATAAPAGTDDPDGTTLTPGANPEVITETPGGTAPAVEVDTLVVAGAPGGTAPGEAGIEAVAGAGAAAGVGPVNAVGAASIQGGATAEPEEAPKIIVGGSFGGQAGGNVQAPPWRLAPAPRTVAPMVIGPSIVIPDLDPPHTQPGLDLTGWGNDLPDNDIWSPSGGTGLDHDLPSLDLDLGKNPGVAGDLPGFERDLVDIEGGRQDDRLPPELRDIRPPSPTVS